MTSFVRQPNPKLYKSDLQQLPESVTLKDVKDSMPKEVYEKDMWKAYEKVVITLVTFTLSLIIIDYSPWWFLPIAWAFAGTAMTGFFVVAHDCGHQSFSDNKWENDIVGIIMMLPLFYPFEPWRIQHNLHHNHTNKLHVDNAWQPFQQEDYATADPLTKTIFELIKGPMWWAASIGHMIKKHFFLSEFQPHQHPKVKVSLAAVYIGAAVFFPYVLYNYGFWAIIKYWLMPYLGYHFWMSTFTMIHHTLPHIPFLPEEQWSDVRARLCMTVHCEYPAWIEFLCHHINVHVPHHVATNIPAYRLRQAWQSLQETYGPYVQSTTFSWELLKDVINNCHLYDSDDAYVSFYSDKTKEYQANRQQSKRN